MTDETEILTNQTRFSSEEPLFQENESGLMNSPHDESKKKVTFFQKHKMVILGGTGVLLIIFSLVMILALSSPRVRKVIVPQPTPSPVAQNSSDQFQSRVQELEGNLKEADPSQLDLSLPPVDMTLSLYKVSL